MTLTLLTSVTTMTTSKIVIAFEKLYAKLCFGLILKRSLSAPLMQVKLLLFIFYLNGRLHAVSIEKPSEQMSKFWTVRFLKTAYEPNFGFPHIPTGGIMFSTSPFVPFVYYQTCEQDILKMNDEILMKTKE